jgi:hypothetical protein
MRVARHVTNMGEMRNTKCGWYTRIEENLEDLGIEWRMTEWLLEKEDVSA